MKIAISNIAWEKEETKDILLLMQMYNITGLEIAPTKIWENPEMISDKELSDYKNFWANNGITIIAMQSLLFGHPELTIFENNTSQDKLVEYMKRITHLASILGIKALVFGSPKNRLKGNLDNGNAVEIAKKFFTKIGDIARNDNVYICIEANPKEYGADFLTTTEETSDFVKSLNHLNIKLHLDTGAMALNHEEYKQTIVDSIPFYHFHISEPSLANVPQIVNHKIVAQTLRDIHYNNGVSIEMRGKDNESNIQGIKHTLEFVSAVYK